MTSVEPIDPSKLLSDQLAVGSPDLLRTMLSTPPKRGSSLRPVDNNGRVNRCGRVGLGACDPPGHARPW